MNFSKLKRRYYYLISGEFASLVIFVSIFLYHVSNSEHLTQWLLRSYSISILSLILIQGIYWWTLKLALLKKQNSTPSESSLLFYKSCKYVNWILLFLYPVLLAVRVTLLHSFDIFNDILFGTLIYSGAILEQINYFHIQLMYDSKADRRFLRRFGELRKGNIAITLQKKGSN